MPPEPSSAPIGLSHRADPAQLAEWMDQPCAYEDFRACLHDLAQVNRLTLAYRPTLHFLDRVCSVGGREEPLHVVDVGCGGGDMLRRIERWAAQRNIAVHLTGIDLNPFAARAAREFMTSGSRIGWVTGDAFSWRPPSGIDVAISSLFTHHLAEAEIVRFLIWMEQVTRRGWFINDLCREPTPLRLFPILARAARWHPFVQHDGPVSFRRSFREDDWQRMLAAAAIPSASARTARWFPARLCVERLK